MRAPMEPASPHVYLDFTQDARGRSHEMAKGCVRRDIEAYQQFLYSNLHLRLLDSYVVSLRRNTQRRMKIDAILEGNESGPLYLRGLLILRGDSALTVDLNAQARVDEERIREANQLPDDAR